MSNEHSKEFQKENRRIEKKKDKRLDIGYKIRHEGKLVKVFVNMEKRHHKERP